jgi:hypothetical protein
LEDVAKFKLDNPGIEVGMIELILEEVVDINTLTHKTEN